MIPSKTGSGETYRLGVIGAGNMGQAILKGAIDAGCLKPAHVIVADVDPRKRDAVALMGCAATDNVRAATNAEQIMLAVKPQVFREVSQTIGALTQDTIVLSIMAGIGSAAIHMALGEHARVIRIMPNTPCQIGFGMTAIARGAGAINGDETLAKTIFAALGEVVEVDESQMHAVTALSGSGPAYLFYLTEAMQEAGEAIGLSKEVARPLAEQTVLGAANLLKQSSATAGELREAVTSPGGTTAAALAVMSDAKINEIIVRAITAARDRGVELDET